VGGVQPFDPLHDLDELLVLLRVVLDFVGAVRYMLLHSRIDEHLLDDGMAHHLRVRNLRALCRSATTEAR
jgi:hypothetical protein